MTIRRLQVQQCRNITQARLDLHPGLNLITGENASGKTSLLEAFYLLGTGRSFRSSRLSHVIQSGHKELTVFAEIERKGGGAHRLGLHYAQGKRQLRLDGQALTSRAELSHLLPIQLINQQSFDLIDQGPGQRRKFLDWGVFHVEHRFYDAWKRYMRAMKQRNALLRQRNQQFEHWEHEMVESAGFLHTFRQAYCERLQPILLTSIRTMLNCDDISMEYRRGWDSGRNLADILASHREKDRELGYSRYGPQRADLVFKRNGAPARERLSRGQQKLLVSALVLAQAALVSEATGKPGTVLIDDISAELDARHCNNLMQSLLATGAQLVVTAIREDLIPEQHRQKTVSHMFHVEHGDVQEVI